MKAEQEIITLSDREHILLRGQMYIGAVDETRSTQLILDGTKFERKEVKYVPGLVKIINEIIDNAVDEAVRTEYEYSTKVKVDITDTSVNVKDNGRGIPVKKINGSNDYMPVAAFCNARSGSNFQDKGRITSGMNGIGSCATNVFSNVFKVTTSDGKNKLTLECKNNLESHEFTVRKNSQQFTEVYFEPDLSRFSVDKIDDVHKSLIEQRLMFLSISHPKISFYLNGNKISINSSKEFMSLFSDNFELLTGDNYFIGVYPNEEDDFNFFTYVNGLFIKNGGNHVNLITNEIVSRLRDKISRKYKSIKPGDIKNKLSVVIFFQEFPDTKFDSQTKETLTNSTAEIRDYLKLDPADWDKFGNKIYKNQSIIDPVIDMFRLKEEFKKRQELKKISSGKKRISNDKYYAPVGDKKYLILSEGDSACGSMMDILGRRDKAYFALKGKPLNTFDRKTLQIVANKEIQAIVDILGLDLTNKDTDMDFEKVILLSDSDSDGYHIRSLLLAFFHKFTPKMIDDGRILFMDTPLLIASKKGKPVKWFYSMEDYQKFLKTDSTKYDWKYMKGLGSLQKSDMAIILEKEGGFESLLTSYKSTEESPAMMEKWMSGKCSDERKEMLRGKQFNVNSI